MLANGTGLRKVAKCEEKNLKQKKGQENIRIQGKKRVDKMEKELV